MVIERWEKEDVVKDCLNGLNGTRRAIIEAIVARGELRWNQTFYVIVSDVAVIGQLPDHRRSCWSFATAR